MTVKDNSCLRSYPVSDSHFSFIGETILDQSGELVCTKPHPSMPVYFWNDPDGSKYHNAYFAKYKGVWCHGDFCLINPDTGGIRMLGRRYISTPLSLFTEIQAWPYDSTFSEIPYSN